MTVPVVSVASAVARIVIATGVPGTAGITPGLAAKVARLAAIKKGPAIAAKPGA